MSEGVRPQLSPREFKLFQTLLIEESGLFFDPERQSLLRSGLETRMAERGIGSVDDYYNFIKGDAEGRLEIKSLIDLVTIGETYFFRNQPQFDVLRDHLLPAIVSERPTGWRTIRIWSAACSTGEEPYSLAMMLLEKLPNPETWEISILATDVNRAHLRKAKEAVYGPRSVRNVPPAWREKYFIERGDRFILKEAVKRMVCFEYHNLVKDSCAMPGMQQVDLLFCRNVTIYFDLETTRRVMDQLAQCLHRNGHLFIGDAETLWQVSDKFAAVEFPHTFVYRHATPTQISKDKPWVNIPQSVDLLTQRSAPPPIEEIAPRTEHAAVATIVETAESLPADPSYEFGREAVQRKDFEKALSHFEAVLRQEPGHLLARLGRASILADQGEYDRAIWNLLEIIRADNLSSEAYYLLGTIYHKTNQLDEAVNAFQRAIYADPGAPLAHFGLANVYRQQGRAAKARREFQNALEALADKPNNELVRYSSDITCEYLRAACEHSKKQLAKPPA